MSRKKRLWSYIAGEKGRNRVRAYENENGYLFLEWWDGKRIRKALKHRDKDMAKAQTDEASAKLAFNREVKHVELSLGALFRRYLNEVTTEKSIRSQKHDHSAANLFLRCFGAQKKPKELSSTEWDFFIGERSKGRLKPHGSRGGKVGPRTVARDLKWLLAVLNWATAKGDGKGGHLLERNPLKGLKVPNEENPNQPLITENRYRAMLAVSGEVDWRFRVALVLAYETGHRIGAIRQLRWSDVDLDTRLLHWDAEFDKMGRDHFTPMSNEAAGIMREALVQNPGVGRRPVLPAPKDREASVSRHLMRNWWKRAERLAGLESVKGLGWHSLRRRFATDYRHNPLADVCELGGWKRGSRVVVELYQKPDLEAQRAVLSSRRRAGGS